MLLSFRLVEVLSQIYIQIFKEDLKRINFVYLFETFKLKQLASYLSFSPIRFEKNNQLTFEVCYECVHTKETSDTNIQILKFFFSFKSFVKYFFGWLEGR